MADTPEDRKRQAWERLERQIVRMDRRLEHQARLLEREERKLECEDREWEHGDKAVEAAPAQPQQTTEGANAVPGPQGGNGDNARVAFVMPILKKKGWSILDWANKSEVDFHTANDYLKGKTKPYPSTRKKLADSLEVAVENLPG